MCFLFYCLKKSLVMKKEHIEAIEELVSAYCEEHGITPKNHQLHVTLSFKPTPAAIVSFEKYSLEEVPAEILSSEIMDCDAVKMLGDYLEDIKYHRPSAAKVVHSVSNIIGKQNPTVRDVVYFSNLDSTWLKYRNLGAKGLRHIDNWLTTLGLKRLPVEPH